MDSFQVSNPALQECDREESIEFIFRNHFTPLCNYARSVLKSEDQAEDVVCNLFKVLCDGKRSFDSPDEMRYYLYKSTYNSCLNVLRKKRCEARYRDRCLQDPGYSKSHDYGSMSHPLSGIIENELDKTIDRIVGGLPPQCRRIYLLSRIGGYSHREIADMLDISLNTVKAHMMNALKKIRSSLKYSIS